MFSRITLGLLLAAACLLTLFVNPWAISQVAARQIEAGPLQDPPLPPPPTVPPIETSPALPTLPAPEATLTPPPVPSEPLPSVVPTLPAEETPPPLPSIIASVVPTPDNPLLPTATPTNGPQADPAFVTVVHQATPNGVVRRGGILVYTIVAVNRGSAPASDTLITMPLDSGKAQLLDVSFSRTSGWVSARNSLRIELRTGRLAAGGDAITATVRLQVLPNGPAQAELATQLSYSWDDRVDGGDGLSNSTVIRLGDADMQRASFELIIVPTSGTGGTERNVEAVIFAPGEPISFWYDTPDGQHIGLNRLEATATGSLNATFDTANIPAGRYTLVAYGNWTGLSASGLFVVE